MVFFYSAIGLVKRQSLPFIMFDLKQLITINFSSPIFVYLTIQLISECLLVTHSRDTFRLTISSKWLKLAHFFLNFLILYNATFRFYIHIRNGLPKSNVVFLWLLSYPIHRPSLLISYCQ